jgi:hypothetical protein
MLMSFFLYVFFSASVDTPGSMYTLDDQGKYGALSDFDATPRLHRSASLPVAAAKVDGNTTDNGDGEWDDFNPPGLTPAIFSSRKWALMKKQRPKRRASKVTPSATASSSSSCILFFRICSQQEAEAPKRGCAKRVNYASLDDDDDDDDFE